MPAAQTTTSTRLDVATRRPEGSRAARRMRREGTVPGVLYGGSEDPLSFAVNARQLRAALASGNAVLDLSVDGAESTPAVLKDIQRDPVRGQTTHLDLLRVRLDRPIQSVVLLELLNGDESPGVKQGGILEQFTRELTIEALPTEIPASITHDVAELDIGDSLLLGAVVAPAGVTILIEEADTVIATISAPRLQASTDTEIETETELVGEKSGAQATSDQNDAESGEQAGE